MFPCVNQSPQEGGITGAACISQGEIPMDSWSEERTNELKIYIAKHLDFLMPNQIFTHPSFVKLQSEYVNTK